MVPGIRITGSNIVNADVTVDATFIPCPAAHAVGVPLAVKRESAAGVRSDMHLCVRLMTDPRMGLAPPDWQYGGCLGDAPPVIAARTDGIPFTTEGWALLDDFICNELDDGPCRPNRATFLKFLRGNAVADLSRSLPLRFPAGSSVKPSGLRNAADLNGIVGLVAGRYENGRVGVRFPDPHGVKALKPECLLTPDGRLADLGDGELQEPEDDIDIGDVDEDAQPEIDFYETMWGTYDGYDQPDNVPAGTVQQCYWTDGIDIVRVKQADGSWKYSTEHDGR